MDLPASSPDSAELLARRQPITPLIELNVSFDSTETPSPQRLHGEPSPSQRRRLDKSMTSLRQLVEFKGTLQSVHKFASNDPIKRFRESAHVHQTRWFCLMEVKSKNHHRGTKQGCEWQNAGSFWLKRRLVLLKTQARFNDKSVVELFIIQRRVMVKPKAYYSLSKSSSIHHP